MSFEYPRLVLSDPEGNIFDHPSLKLSGRSGDRFLLPAPSELMPLPKGSQLFTLPGRVPIGWDEEKRSFVPSRKVRLGEKEVKATAAAAFLPPGYIRTSLPATQRGHGAPILPLWAYSAVGWKDGRFWATGLLIDPNPHWHPKYFKNDGLLKRKVHASLSKILRIAFFNNFPGVHWNITVLRQKMFSFEDGNVRCLLPLHAMQIV